jgi:hypothetical protein
MLYLVYNILYNIKYINLYKKLKDIEIIIYKRLKLRY